MKLYFPINCVSCVSGLYQNRTIGTPSMPHRTLLFSLISGVESLTGNGHIVRLITPEYCVFHHFLLPEIAGVQIPGQHFMYLYILFHKYSFLLRRGFLRVFRYPLPRVSSAFSVTLAVYRLICSGSCPFLLFSVSAKTVFLSKTIVFYLLSSFVLSCSQHLKPISPKVPVHAVSLLVSCLSSGISPYVI